MGLDMYWNTKRKEKENVTKERFEIMKEKFPKLMASNKSNM